MGHVLDQGSVWIDKHGNPHPVKNMTGQYAANAKHSLLRNVRYVADGYVRYLSRLPMPNGDAAADAVETDIDRQMSEINDDPELWLLNKPLIKALEERAAAEGITHAMKVRPAEGAITLPSFRIKPPSVDDWSRQEVSTDKVFLVSEGSHEDYSVLTVFVGNRIAAQQYAAEHNRYERLSAVVEELDDHSVSLPVMREYPPAYTQVTFVSRVHETATGPRLSGQFTKTAVVQGNDPHLTTTAEPMKWGRSTGGMVTVEIRTSGPDFKLGEIRDQHRDKIRQIMAALQDDPKGGI